MLDNMKDLGYKFSTKSGTTISAGDVVAYTDKYESFKVADEKVEQINEFYQMGMLTENEKRQRVIKV
jgi:DNA-directed RNA polymerase subunit beta'